MADPISLVDERSRRIIRDHQMADTYLRLGPLFDDLGIRLERKRLTVDVDGTTKYLDGASRSGFIVLVNSGMTMVRQRFTAAHEMGHALLHGDDIKSEDPAAIFEEFDRDTNFEPHYDPILGSWEYDEFDRLLDPSRYKREKEADEFAASLLMPLSSISLLRRQGVREWNALAKRMGVSTISMRRRLKEMGV